MDHGLKTNLETRSADPYLLIIPVNLNHTACGFARFLSTSGQSASAAEITCPKHLKDFTISRGRLYTLKALHVTALSSSARRRHFCSAPFLHCAVRQCIPFKYRHGTSMSHRRHHRWGRLISSSITSVSQT